mgnify:CR=1 FL=1
MRTRMVPFQRHVQRLARIVRQAATDTHKKEMLMDALKTAQMGLTSADLASAQKNAMNAEMTLKKAM